MFSPIELRTGEGAALINSALTVVQKWEGAKMELINKVLWVIIAAGSGVGIITLAGLGAIAFIMTIKILKEM